MLSTSPVVVSPTIDRITVEESLRLFLNLQKDGHSVDVAARVTAEWIDQQLAQYPPLARAS